MLVGGQRVRAIPQTTGKGTAMTIVEDACVITGSVDTHADMHVAAALDPLGGLLGVALAITFRLGLSAVCCPVSRPAWSC
jgi:hypothetical protein